MPQLLPFAKSVVGVAFVVVVVLTLIMTFVPPNKSPLYKLGTVVFMLVVLIAAGLGAIVLVTTLLPR